MQVFIGSLMVVVGALILYHRSSIYDSWLRYRVERDVQFWKEYQVEFVRYNGMWLVLFGGLFLVLMGVALMFG